MALPRLVCVLLMAGCSAPDDGRVEVPPGPRGARPDLLKLLREDLEMPRHPSDGGGTARIVEETGEPVPAGALDRWVLRYEAGPEGIAEGGAIYFQTSPFWEWSPAQTVTAEAPGYMAVSTDAEGLEIATTTLGQGLIEIRVTGRAMRPGESVTLDYGAGPRGARADAYAEDESPLWIAVDGDGDGIRAWIDDPPTVRIVPGPARQIVATVPSIVRPDTATEIRIAQLDRRANAVTWERAAVEIESEPAGLAVLATPRISPSGLSATVDLRTPAEEGVWRFRVRVDEFETVTAPMRVSATRPRLLWADLHGHSAFSDGSATPEQYFTYARDVAGLDVVSLTDHDHWGVLPLAAHPRLWNRIWAAAESFHSPPGFLTVLGFEWTNWIHGHRHVLYFDGRGEILSSVDPRYERPEQLWEALRGRDAMTVAHHSAGGPVPTDWSIPPDPELEPVTEVVSVHGVSEAPDAPGTIYAAVEGNFVRDALDRGYRLGFVGSGDGHDGHPGLTHLAGPSGGLAAIFSEGRSRADVLAALRARSVYATNGPRIVLGTRLGAAPMGSEVGRDPGALTVVVDGTGPIDRIDMVTPSGVIGRKACEGSLHCTAVFDPGQLDSGDYVYARVFQLDGGAAWSSPYFVR